MPGALGWLWLSQQPGRVRVIALCVLLCVVGLGEPAPEARSAGRTGRSALRADAVARAAGSFSFGQWAGYIWRGRVTSVSATWTMPRVVGSLPGVAATWIGAQGSAPGPTQLITAIQSRNRSGASVTPGPIVSAPQIPFIQVGTQEGRLVLPHGRRRNYYRAFWSDTAQGDNLQPLMSVKAGDRMSAKLSLAAGRWSVSIRDVSSNKGDHFSTRDGGEATYNQADWLQEHVPVAPGFDFQSHAYPQLATFRIRQLEVDSVAPRYAGIESLWMSEDGGYLAPSRLSNDSFSFGRARLSRPGMRYLKLADAEDPAAKTFSAQLAGWTSATTHSEIDSESSTFTRVLQRSIAGFAWPGWPPALIAIRRLLRRTRALLAQTTSASRVSAGQLTRWMSTWKRDAVAARTAGREDRRALHVPEYTPVY